MSQTLPDSGGAYFHRDAGGGTGVGRRNVRAAVAQVRNGDAGATAVGFAIGAALVPAAKYAADRTGLM